MTVARSAAEILSQHTTLALECIDRLYLNVYVPVLQRAAGAAYFFRKVRGVSVPSSVLMAPITQRFVDAIKRYAERNGIDVVLFRRGERKDERTQQYLRKWSGGEGVLYIGKAQEKARVLRTERRRRPSTGATYAWLVDSTAMVNHYYFYVVDDDFGPLFMGLNAADVLPGTLDLLIPKAISLERLHGYGVLLRIRQISGEALDVPQGSLYPALNRLEHQGLIESE